MDVLAVFGPTAVGKTGVSLELAELLRGRGEHPVAVNCDSIQVYARLGVLSGAASAAERERLEHRLVGFVPVAEEFSAGRFAELAHAEIDHLIAEDRLPLVVGGAGLYLRAALAELELRPPVPAEVREGVERDIAARGSGALHAELPAATAETVHPNDRKRVARMAELHRSGIEPHLSTEGLWTERLRVPTTLIGLTCGRDELDRRIDQRVDAMVAAGAPEEARRAAGAGASRTARAAIGFEELLAGDVPAMKLAQRRFARRQLTWMRKMPGVRLVDRSGRSDREVAEEIVRSLYARDP
jgi:tRNA dimethylallyltransferase